MIRCATGHHNGAANVITTCITVHYLSAAHTLNYNATKQFHRPVAVIDEAGAIEDIR